MSCSLSLTLKLQPNETNQTPLIHLSIALILLMQVLITKEILQKMFLSISASLLLYIILLKLNEITENHLRKLVFVLYAACMCYCLESAAF